MERFLQRRTNDVRQVTGIEQVGGVEFGDLLREDQLRFLEMELQLQLLTLDEHGAIHYPVEAEVTDTVAAWRSKEGVIDAKNVEGALVIVFNGNEIVPAGCPDLRQVEGHDADGRAGQYDPEANICFIDISSTWNFLHERYQPEWVQQIVRHELRHAFVHRLDEGRLQDSGVAERRNLDDETMDPEVYRQLAYLDELHSQFMDVIEGESREGFVGIDSLFYSTAGKGTHMEIASNTDQGKEDVRIIFAILQKCITAQEGVSENTDEALRKKIQIQAAAIGAIIATGRSLRAVAEQLSTLFAGI